MTAIALLQSTPALYVYASLLGIFIGSMYLSDDTDFWPCIWNSIVSLLVLGFFMVCGLKNPRIINPWLIATALAPVSYYTFIFLGFVRESRSRRRTLVASLNSIPIEHRSGKSPIRWWSHLDHPGFLKADKALKALAKESSIDDAVVLFSKITRDHATTLSRKRTQNSYYDEYSKLRDGAWREHANYFIYNVALPQLKEDNKFVDLPYSRWYELLNELIPYKAGSPVDLIEIPYASVETGPDYEAYVAGILRAGDWQAQLTPRTGDHGADIIATRDGKRVAVQCKFYSSPVGNKCVQEIYSAKDFYACDAAVVVSNADYTKHARKIAASLNVALLHHDMLIQTLNDVRPEDDALRISSSDRV
jgi:restriction system protein